MCSAMTDSGSALSLDDVRARHEAEVNKDDDNSNDPVRDYPNDHNQQTKGSRFKDTFKRLQSKGVPNSSEYSKDNSICESNCEYRSGNSHSGSSQHPIHPEENGPESLNGGTSQRRSENVTGLSYSHIVPNSCLPINSATGSKPNSENTSQENSTHRISELNVHGLASLTMGNAKNSKPRGILKNTKSDPIIVISEPVEKLKHSHSEPTGVVESTVPAWPRFNKRTFPNVSTGDFRSSQEFVNPAFELDETIPTDSKLSDIVERVLKQQFDHSRFVHPFGQNNLYSSIFQDKGPTITDSDRMVFWLIFVLLLLGIAGAIILMSEMYRLDVLEANALLNKTIVPS